MRFRLKHFTIIFLIASHISIAQTNDTTKIGVYLTSIYDLNYEENSFSVEFWMWRINTNREFKENYLFNTSNSKQSEKLFSSTEWLDQSENKILSDVGDTIFWDYESFRSIIKHDYDITKYPFDEETLIIQFEGDTYYDDWVKLKIDSKESGNSEIKINGWNVGEMQIERVNNKYSSNFGSPGDKGDHTYAGFNVLLPIKRQGTALFFKLFTGLFVAFVIALFSLRINIAEADGRFGVCVGALFAALANMYIVNSNLPLVSRFTFMDKAHVLVIMLILVLFVTSTFSLQYYKTDKLTMSKRVDQVVTYSVIAIFLLGMIIIWPY